MGCGEAVGGEVGGWVMMNTLVVTVMGRMVDG